MSKALLQARFAKFADPRDVPIYTIAEAAHYLTIPGTTIRSWVCGRSYRAGETERRFRNVIKRPCPDSPLLSFYNLAEAHILRALRTQHGVSLAAIRKALAFVASRLGQDRPLIRNEFKTDGVSLFVEHYHGLVDASQGGQAVMRELIESHLKRLEWKDGRVARLYPFTRASSDSGPKWVLIDPRFSFGRPVLSKSHVATAVIAERYKAGESIQELAADYDCTEQEIEEGVRCELRVGVAA